VGIFSYSYIFPVKFLCDSCEILAFQTDPGGITTQPSPRRHLSLAPSVASPWIRANAARLTRPGTSPPSFLMQLQALPALARVDAVTGLDGGCVRGSTMETRPWRPLPRRQHRQIRRPALLAAACTDP